jgi:hypothetical protein
MSMFIEEIDIFNRYVDSIDTSGFFLTRATAIDITLLLGQLMDHAASLLPRSDTRKNDDLPLGSQGGIGRPKLNDWT